MRYKPRRAWNEGITHGVTTASERVVPLPAPEFIIPPRSFTSTPLTAEQHFALQNDVAPKSPQIFRDDPMTLAEFYEQEALFVKPLEVTLDRKESAGCDELESQVSEYLEARERLIKDGLIEAANQLGNDIRALIVSAQQSGLTATNPELRGKLEDVLNELALAA